MEFISLFLSGALWILMSGCSAKTLGNKCIWNGFPVTLLSFSLSETSVLLSVHPAGTEASVSYCDNYTKPDSKKRE